MGIVEGVFSSWENTSCLFGAVIDFRNLLGFLVSFTPRPVWLEFSEMHHLHQETEKVFVMLLTCFWQKRASLELLNVAPAAPCLCI